MFCHSTISSIYISFCDTVFYFTLIINLNVTFICVRQTQGCIQIKQQLVLLIINVVAIYWTFEFDIICAILHDNGYYTVLTYSASGGGGGVYYTELHYFTLHFWLFLCMV